MDKSIENLSEGVPEFAKHCSVSIKLDGWPAAAVLISLPISVVCIYAIKTRANL